MAYQYITKQTSPNRTPANRKAKDITQIVIHWWDDPRKKPSFNGVVSWLCRKNGGSSAHYVIESGRIACIVSPKDIAWHAGSWGANSTGIGLEINPRLSDGDYDTAAELIAELWKTYGKKPLRRHRDVSSLGTTCPGTLDMGRLQRLAESYYTGAAKPAAKPATKPAAKKPASKPTAKKPAAKKSTGKRWPSVALQVTSTHTAASHAAWVKLMADVGYKDRSLTTAIQKWLRKLGYYKGKIDTVFGSYTIDALQRKLRDDGLYTGALDAFRVPPSKSRGPMMIRAEIAYLNQQRRFYKK